MFHDVKAPSTPSKGKGREESHWHCGWWEIYPLLEPRPVEWTRSSTLFTAHANEPLLVGRLFSSSKQFTIPSPSPVASSPASYDPPSIISVSPNDEWLFAYFPGRDGDGTGCLWRRGMQVDIWTIKEWWSFARGAGVVAASWAGSDREWIINDTGKPSRLPPRGPATPISAPTLLLVTQAHQLQVCYIRTYVPSLKIMICSLIQPGVTSENKPHPIYGESGRIKLCRHAAIGKGYNESSILIAMRSHLLPSPTTKSSQFNPMDLGLPLNMSQQAPSSEINPTIDWRPWGEESTIELCEVLLSFDGASMSLTSNPLPPIYHSNSHLSNLTFICTPPPSHLSSEPPRSSQTSRQKEGRRSDDNDNGRFYLLASFLDFNDYTAAPKSELVLHSIVRNVPAPNTKRPTWISHHESSRWFLTGVLTFVAPCVVSLNLEPACVYVGILDTSGTISQPRSRIKDASVGYVIVLTLPDLQNHGEWENSPIMSPVDRVGKELPLYAAVSPNFVLLCTVSSSLWTVQTSIHAFPKRISTPDTVSRPPLSAALASAIHSRTAISDLAHALSLPATSIDEVVETLYSALSTLEADPNGLLSIWAWDVLGAAVNIYRTRACRTERSRDRENLSSRSQTAHDICSLIACNFAFEDCKEGETYGLEAVWQLVALSGWIISFLEKLMKECVLFSDMSGTSPPHHSSDDVFGSGSPSSAIESKTRALDSPILLHLIQPFALTNLLSALLHVRRLRKQLGALSAKGETAQIARDILVDLVDCSGMDLNALESTFVECMPDAKAFGADEARRSLALCHPTTVMDSPLRKAVMKLTTSNVLDKPSLFLKASDLADETSQLSMYDHPNKDKGKDVISKGVLMNRGPSFVCLGCGNRSEVGGIIAGHISLGWRAWERMWTSRCICGGLWASGPM